MTIKAMARQGQATARRREHQNGGVDRKARGREASGPGKTWPTNRCHGRPKKRSGVERDGRPESLPSISRYSRRVLSMLKPLTLSLSLAVALGLCSVSKAGLHDSNCTTCGLASPQGVVASPQGNYAGGCGERPAGKKHQLRQLPEEPLPPRGHLRVGPEEEARLAPRRQRLQHLRHAAAPVYATGQARGPVGPVRGPVGPVCGPVGPVRGPAGLRRRPASRSSRPGRRPASPRCPPR